MDNKIEISSESDEENSPLPTNLSIEQLQVLAKKYYKLKNSKQELKSADNVDFYTQEKTKLNETDKTGENIYNKKKHLKA